MYHLEKHIIYVGLVFLVFFTNHLKTKTLSPFFLRIKMDEDIMKGNAAWLTEMLATRR